MFHLLKKTNVDYNLLSIFSLYVLFFMSQYLFCTKSNIRRLEFNDAVFFSFVNKKG